MQREEKSPTVTISLAAHCVISAQKAVEMDETHVLSGKLIKSCHPFMQTASSKIYVFNDTASTEIYTLSLHDALPISIVKSDVFRMKFCLWPLLRTRMLAQTFP